MARESRGTSGLPPSRTTCRAPRARGAVRALWRLVSATLIVAGLSLVAFHAWLFWDQWQIGRLSDPLLLAKWAGSAVLVAALAVCHRRKVSLLHGRKALVLWTLAAVLHVGADHPGISVAPETASAVLFVLPSAAVTALLAAGLVLASRRSRASVRPAARTTVRPAPLPFRPSPLLASPRGLRAPPLRFA